MRSGIVNVAALVCGIELACVGTLHAGLLPPSRLNLAMGTIGSLSATPGTIHFQASNPDLGLVSGSSVGSLSWLVVSGSHLQNWSLTLQAGSSSFAGCSHIPLSAVRVSCTAASVSGGGGSGSCSGSIPLSTVPQQIAGGVEGDDTNTYSISINFTVDESWHYVANSSCTLTINYVVNAP